MYGRECIFLGAASKKFTPGHLPITEEMIKLAEETLNPPSVGMTGDEVDLFYPERVCFLKTLS